MWGLRPACLAEPCGPQERVQLCTVEHIADVVPMVQILDAPVPRVGEQGVDQLVEAFRHLDLLIPEQVIEVPKISSSRRRCRRGRLPVQQMAEQLVEVPEFVSFAHAIHRQIADIPIPQVGCLSSGSVQGFLPGQDYFLFLEQTVDTPVPQGRRGEGGGLQSFLPVQNSTAFCGADHQIVDIPARGGLQGSHPEQSSSSSSWPRFADQAADGFFFARFSPWKKVRGAGQVGARVHPHSSSSELSPHQMARPQFTDGSMPGYFWRDAAGRVWMRSFAFPGTWVCSGEDGEDIYWDEPG